MEKLSLKERQERFTQYGSLYCSVCGGAVHNLQEGCMSKFCPRNEGDTSLEQTIIA